MKKLLLSFALVLATAAAPVMAGKCMTNDSWTSPDKPKHLAAGAAIGAAGTLVFRDPKVGFWAGTAAGFGLEIYSARTGHGTCSLQDALVTTAGAALGAGAVNWLILPRLNERGRVDGLQAAYAVRF